MKPKALRRLAHPVHEDQPPAQSLVAVLQRPCIVGRAVPLVCALHRREFNDDEAVRCGLTFDYANLGSTRKVASTVLHDRSCRELSVLGSSSFVENADFRNY